MEKHDQSEKFKFSGKHSQGGATAGFLFAVLLMLAASAWAEPVKVWPSNPHYFFYKDKPLVLITSDHHYGAVIDRDFDFARYLDFLAAQGMNLTRIYPGGMFEPPGKYIAGNPLGPAPGRQILPWAKSNQKSALIPRWPKPSQPSFKFDLDKWNPEYFTRLKTFVEMANQKRHHCRSRLLQRHVRGLLAVDGDVPRQQHPGYRPIRSQRLRPIHHDG